MIGMTEAEIAREEQRFQRVHYAIEYIDRAGRRRQEKKSTLRGAESFKRRLRLGSDPKIRLVTRRSR
jgi:hypothetical protein